jgi:citrate/tricarballylate utilization protein
MPGLEDLLPEADRQFTICNACRYCEDYCPVFPALERRSLFGEGDLGFVSSLCHDCRACYQACMYTEPHEFAINIPELMATSRVASYERYARPSRLGRAFEAGPGALGLLTAVAFAVVFAAYAAFGSLDELFDVRQGPGSLYESVSHVAMAVPALLLTAYGAFVVGLGLRAFWRDAGGRTRELADLRLWGTALREAGALSGMRGGGGDCYFQEEQRASPVRRRMHGLVFYGFLLTFGATVAAFIAEWVFGVLPPYPVLSVPVMLGLVGGVGMTIGCIGLLAMKRTNPPHLSTSESRVLDLAFLWTLFACSVTGLALLVLRDTSLMGSMLLAHLATVLVLYLTAPYGKMVHGVYRFGALLKDVQERRAGAA